MYSIWNSIGIFWCGFTLHYYSYKKAIDVARQRLSVDSTLEDRTALSVSEVTQLLKFCLNATYLSYNNEFFRQTFGTAMGSPVSVTVANLVMEDIEDKGISTYPTPPPFWKRFVDDIITALPKVSVQPFLNHLNSIEDTINFTVELESNGELSFLDTTVKHNSNGTLSTTIFRKKTHTDKYLSFASHHPIAHKIAVIKTLFCRANSICGSDQDRNVERAHIRSALKMNGYPSRVISNAMRARPASSSKVMMKPKATVVLPYMKNVSECIKRILLPLDIRTCFKPRTTLRQLLVHPKDPIPVESQTGVI